MLEAWHGGFRRQETPGPRGVGVGFAEAHDHEGDGRDRHDECEGGKHREEPVAATLRADGGAERAAVFVGLIGAAATGAGYDLKGHGGWVSGGFSAGKLTTCRAKGIKNNTYFTLTGVVPDGARMAGCGSFIRWLRLDALKIAQRFSAGNREPLWQQSPGGTEEPSCRPLRDFAGLSTRSPSTEVLGYCRTCP